MLCDNIRLEIARVMDFLRDSLTENGFTKRRDNYYYYGENISMVNVQKSNFGYSYYLNCSIFIITDSIGRYPKENHGDVRFRASRLECEYDLFDCALNFDNQMETDRRISIISPVISKVIYILTESSTLPGFLSIYKRNMLPKNSVTILASKHISSLLYT